MDRTRVYQTLNEKLSEPRYRDLYRAVEEAFARSGNVAHNWEHVRRVVVNSVHVALEERANIDIVLAAAILHDLGYATDPDKPKQHPMIGAEKCYPYLEAWSPAERDLISGCVLKHKGTYPGYGIEPESLEEKVVCDADQVDKFGWVGFMQMVKVYIEYGIRGHDHYSTLVGLAEAITHRSAMTFYTETGRAFADSMVGPDNEEISRVLTDQLSLYEDWTEPF